MNALEQEQAVSGRRLVVETQKRRLQAQAHEDWYGDVSYTYIVTPQFDAVQPDGATQPVMLEAERWRFSARKASVAAVLRSKRPANLTATTR
jgi:hypothetical protein